MEKRADISEESTPIVESGQGLSHKSLEDHCTKTAADRAMTNCRKCKDRECRKPDKQ